MRFRIQGLDSRATSLFLPLLAIFTLVAFFSGCGGGSLESSLPSSQSLSPSHATVSAGQSSVFQIPSSGTNVTWSVNGVQNGNSVLGLVSSGTYTAPAVATSEPTQMVAQWRSEKGATESASATVQINNPAPQLIQRSPAATLISTPDFSFTVVGSGFTPGSKVLFGAQVLPTVYVSATQLAAAIPSPLLQTAQLTSIKVRNDAPGGG